ncbi:MAG: hypothetical protein QOH27_2719 [Mycobacterium sp.]|nr:hypothetical protein [Mycobacterium sp.]
MRRQAQAEAEAEAAVCRSAEVDPDLVVEVVTVVPVDLLVVAVTSAAAAPAGLVTVGLVAPAVLVDLVTSVDLAAPVGLAVPVTSAEAVPVARVATTSDRGHPTPSAASVVNRGAMEQRHGAGELRREPAGAARSLHLEGFGTKGRSTTTATTSSRYGIRAKTVGASTSSESGSRCN